MSLGIKQTKTYLNVKEGRIYQGSIAYDYVEGYLRGIETKEREFNGERVKYFYFDILSDSGELYSLALPYYGGVAKSLINSLASAQGFTDPIRIQTYQSGDFTKVATYQSGQRLPWKHSQLPPVEELRIGDRIVKDDSKRMALIASIVITVNSIIKGI